MKLRPLHDRIVIKRIEAEAKSAGGIIIPDTAKEKPQQGEVVAVGPGGRDESGKFIPIDVKAGDRVLFGKWSGTEVKIDDEDYLIMKESDVMGGSGRDRGTQEGCVTTLAASAPRSRKQSEHKYILLRSYAHVCQGSQVFRRRTRQDAARH
jgi:chaperonin GroES